MGNKDVKTTEYFEDPARFADVVNTYVFSGNQQILPENIHVRENSDRITADTQDAKTITVTRDVVRNVDVMMNTTIIALENQSDVHYAMPVRVMTGDAAAYHGQWRALARQHYENKDLKKKEYLSGLRKGEKLIPSSTIVLYFGEDAWDGPRRLKDMLALEDLPIEMQEFIADYPLHILEVRRFKDYEQFQTDFRLVCGFLQNDQDADALEQYLTEHKEAFSDMAPDAVHLISQYSHSRDLLENVQQDNYQTDAGGYNMCKAIDDMMARNKNEGIEIGTERGIEIGIENCIKLLRQLNTTKDTILEMISQNFSISPEHAASYLQKYW